jgi:hypothetical protein
MFSVGHICIYPPNRLMCVSSLCLPVLYFILFIPVGDYTNVTTRVLRENNFDPIKALESFHVPLKYVARTCLPGCERKLCRWWELFRGSLIHIVGGCSSVGRCYVISVFGAQIDVWMKYVIGKGMLLELCCRRRTHRRQYVHRICV